MQELCALQYNRAKKLLSERKGEMQRLVAKLMEKESVELDELNDILGPSDHENKAAFESYINDLKKKKLDQAEAAKAKADKDQGKDKAAAEKPKK